MLTAPCEWDLIGCGECDALRRIDPSVRTAVESAAVDYLWRATGRAFGTCEVTLRPCRSDCHSSTYHTRVPALPGSTGTTSTGYPFEPVLIDGDWFNVSCGRCGSRCSCNAISEIVLPGPVASVAEITIDGTVLWSQDDSPPNPLPFRVDNHTRLVRTDGGTWPYCQDMSAPTTETNTFAVTYSYGVAVPASGQLAAGLLACELAKSLCGDDSCELPGRVETVTREGVTMVLMPPENREGLTGIWAIDSFITSVTKSRRNARVINPDTWLEQRRRTT